MSWKKAYTKTIEEYQEKNDKFNIKYKDESLFMKILGGLLFFNKGFMKRYTTTIGHTVYFPSRDFVIRSYERSLRTILHEIVHVEDYRKNPAKFVLGYTFPQNLGLLSVFAFLGFVSPWFLLFLVFLVAFAPWPAPFREGYEVRGYAVGVAWRYITNKYHVHSHIEWLVFNVFMGWDYYKMTWRPGSFIKRMKKVEEMEKRMRVESVRHRDKIRELIELGKS